MIRSPQEHKYLHVNGIQLHVVEAGPSEGKPLILLHGFPEFWYSWRNQIDALVGAGFRLIIPDQRGYNLSDRPPDASLYSLDTLADDIIGLIDYTEQDWDGSGPYDLILDMVGERPFELYVKNLTPEGRMVSVGALVMEDMMAFMAKMGGYKASEEEPRVFNFMAQFNTDDLTTLAELMASGAVSSVIDRTFPLEETAAAMTMQGSKRISGKVVVTMEV